MAEVSSLAVFVDFENLALGFQDRKDRFDIQRVLRRLVEKGKIIVKRGYADWSRYSDYKRSLHEAGLELIEIPRRALTGKNSADIRLVVDAMDMSYGKEHIDTFVIVSGDSDFSPLVAKLKENGKRVLGLAMRKSSSDLLVNACDEFIFYEELEAELAHERTALRRSRTGDGGEVFALLLETLTALQREVAGPILASMIKDTIRRKQPSFSESAYGYRSFSALLEAAQAAGFLQLSTDPRSGTYVVTEFQAAAPATTPPARATAPPARATAPPARRVPQRRPRPGPAAVPGGGAGSAEETIPAGVNSEVLSTADKGAPPPPSRRRRRRRPEGSGPEGGEGAGDNGMRRSRRRRRSRVRDTAREALP